MLIRSKNGTFYDENPALNNLLENGASLPEVQAILGHKCVETTSRYLHVAGPERAQAMKKHPLNDYLSEIVAKETR